MPDLRAAAALLLLLLLVPAPPAAAGEEPRDTALAAEVEGLVRRLGSSSFEEREAAYEKLDADPEAQPLRERFFEIVKSMQTEYLWKME